MSNMYDGFKFKKYLQGPGVSKFEATREPGWNSQRDRKTFLMTISFVETERRAIMVCGGDCDGEDRLTICSHYKVVTVIKFNLYYTYYTILYLFMTYL